MGSLQSTEKSKRMLFLSVTGAGVAASLALTPWLGVPVAGYGLYLGWDWFKYRAKNGMRF